MSRQQDWQRKMIAEGRCRTCGKERGLNGTTRHCRVCANKSNVINKACKARKRNAEAS